MASYIWIRKTQNVEIRTLNDLLETVTNIPLADVDEEVTRNLIAGNLVSWVEENFPTKLILTTTLRRALEEFTPQQLREKLIRELRKHAEA